MIRADRNRADECRGELVLRERRGLSTEASQLALEAHLEQCESCRFARQVLADFEEASAVELRDGARIERLSTIARRYAEAQRPGRRPPARPPRRAFEVAALATALLLLVGSASATLYFWQRATPGPVQTVQAPGRAAPAAQTRPHARRPAAPKPSAEPVASVPSVVDLPVEAAPAAVPEAHAARGRLARRFEASGESPAELLRAAGAARRDGEGARAVSLYQKLKQQFPASPEASLSSVALGRLLLDRGSARAALAEFDAYLRSAPSGALSPEALYGRARALAALGDRARERQGWQQLVAAYPGSAYAPLARRRLAELE